MARPSSASLSVVPVRAMARISPPDGLRDEEMELWQQVVDSKPVEWFGVDSAPLLKEYVRAVHMCDRLQARIDMEMGGDEVPDKLLRLRDLESKRAVTIATKLRLTQQSRYTPQAANTAAKKASGDRPWAAQG